MQSVRVEVVLLSRLQPEALRQLVVSLAAMLGLVYLRVT